MYEKVFTSRGFLRISKDIYNEIEKNISKMFEQYDKKTLLESSIIFNHLVSDISNASVDWFRWEDPDEYYTTQIFTEKFKELFFLKYKDEDSTRTKRVYSGILEMDMCLHIDVNNLGLFSEIFGWKNYQHTITELSFFSMLIRPLTDSIPYMVNYYCKGEDKVNCLDSHLVFINLSLMFLFPLANHYYYVISSILDEENEIIITYDDSDNMTYFRVKNLYTGLDPSDMGPVPPLKPFRVPPDYVYNPEELIMPENPSFFSPIEFHTTIDNQFKVFNQYINEINDIPLDIFQNYAKFIIDEVGQSCYKKYNNIENLIEAACTYCKISKEIALKLIQLSSTKEKNAIDSQFIQKPILIDGDEYYLMSYPVPRWSIILLDENAEPKKSYQIQMGFIFEKEVKSLMKKYGLDVLEVKRIKDSKESQYSNREFDVLINYNDKIYDFQCKNYKLNYNPNPSELKLLKRKHNEVLRRVIAGLEDENEKIEVLEKKYKKEIEFYIISRFPILTKNPRVITYNKLEEWLKNFTGNEKGYC